MIWINKKLRDMREEEGFTLIELMVVVLIIAILIAIAIPTFLGARQRAQDRAAQSDLRNTVTAAKALYTDRSTYNDATEVALEGAEPSIDFDGAAASTVDTVSVVAVPATPQHFYAAKLSASGQCWFIRDSVVPNPATNPGTRWARDGGDGAPACTAAAAALLTDANFASRTPAGAAAV